MLDNTNRETIPLRITASREGRPQPVPDLRHPTGRQVLAAVMEYLSMLPSPCLLFEILPLERLARRPGSLGRAITRLHQTGVVCLPWRLRLVLARLNPDYDPSLSAWPQSAAAYPRNLQAWPRVKRRLHQGRWLEGYSYFWAARRPATRQRLTLPLFYYLGGAHHPAPATLGVFAVSGLLHALWYPFIPLYFILARFDLAATLFAAIWAGYTLLGLPVAWYHHRRGRKKQRK